MAERDLAGNRDEAHQTQCPSRALRVEADFNQVFRLVHLHQIPGQQSTEIAERQPPEAPRAQGSRERPINRSRAATREPVGRRCDRARRTAIRLETQIGRLASQQQIERCQRYEYEKAKRPACSAPAPFGNQALQPGKDRHGADADPGKCDAQRQPTPPHKPAGQVKRLHRVGEQVDAAADERAEAQIELPRFPDQRCQQQAAAHRHDAGFDGEPWAAAIGQPADARRDDRRNQKPEREGPGGNAAIPPEFVKDRREQQGERGAGIDADRHRHKRHCDEDPPVEKRQPDPAHHDLLRGTGAFAHHAIKFSGVSWAATRRMFSAMSLARASSIPSVQPETCGVISTFGSS